MAILCASVPSRGRASQLPWVARRHRRRSDVSPEAAFTLVELMIAVFLLTIGVLAMMQVFTISNRHTAFAREETMATSLAREIQEKILSETFDDTESIFDGIDTTDPETIPLPAEEWAAHVNERLGPTGRGTVEVINPAEDATISNGMIAVVVTMSWYEGDHEVTLPLRFAVAKIGA